ncbi:MAG TPA: rRNA methyltransferase, partial [Acinetobacter sp.]|nr:rRNA methyltransferase [Acinetobacter sp.]
MQCWYQAEFETEFQQLQLRFAELNIQLNGQAIEKANARFLRLNPEI